MTPVQTLFGFKGRLRRSDWWVWVIGLAIVHVAVGAILLFGLGLGEFDPGKPFGSLFGAARRLPLWVAVPFELLFLWPSAALGVKRSHDRNISGWPVAVFYAVAMVMSFVSRPAGDAIEQLKIWADRSGAAFLSAPTGSDSASLAFDAVEKARAEGFDVVLIDTAGRLQNKQDLMNELLKVIRVIKKVDPEAPHETLLVLDATVGRNALAQEKIFGNQVGVSGIVMTKLDGTARGGVLVPVAQASDSPIKLIGVGEAIEDLQPFDARAFSRSLVGLEA